MYKYTSQISNDRMLENFALDNTQDDNQNRKSVKHKKFMEKETYRIVTKNQMVEPENINE